METVSSVRSGVRVTPVGSTMVLASSRNSRLVASRELLKVRMKCEYDSRVGAVNWQISITWKIG